MLRNLCQGAIKAAYPTLHVLPYVSPLAKAHSTLYARSLNYIAVQNFAERKPPRGFERFERRQGRKRQSSPKEGEKEDEDAQEIEIEVEEPIKKRGAQEKTQAERKRREVEEEREERKQSKKQDEEEFIEDDEPPKKTQKKKEKGFSFSFSTGNSEKDKKDPNPPQKFKFSHLMLVLIGGMSVYALINEYQHSRNEVAYVDFIKNYLLAGKVSSINIKREANKSSYVTFAEVNTLEGNKILKLGNLDHFLEEIETIQLRMGRTPESLIPISFQYNAEGDKGFKRFVNLFWLAAVIYIFLFFAKDFKSTMGSLGKGPGGGAGNDIFGVGKSQVKIFGVENKVKQRFKDVAGLDEAKVEIMEFVEFLKKPKKFKELGAKIPRGALLSGPPGTGKTLLAKAAAGEAGVPFLSISGSDFVEMFVGVGASRVRDLFKKAKEHAPAIIFIDEIDAVGRKRESKMGGNDERDNTLNQLLVEMDGFGTETNVVILAATNRKELLDPALTRPGRFDRSIEITLPDIEGRKQVFMVHLKPLKLDPEKTMEDYAKRLATLTPGFSGADIGNLCNEAAILAARKNKKFVSSDDFEAATERVIGGLEKKGIVSEEEKKTVAIHESGHAVVSWFLEGGAPLLKLTIIPRSKGSLGFAQYLPNETSLESKDELMDRICCILGGRCSEELFRTKITTGASDDLRKAYDIAEAIVTKLGMSAKIGNRAFPQTDYGKAYSDLTGKDIDLEIKSIIDECTERTRSVVRQYRDQIEKLSNTLLEKETLDLTAIIEILGQRPFAPKSNFKAYLEYKTQQEQEIEAIKEKEEEEVTDAETKEESNEEGEKKKETKE